MPLECTIIALPEQLPPTPLLASAAVGSLRLWNKLQRSRLFGAWHEREQPQIILWGNGTALSSKVLSGFLTTSQEWAMNDPVWWQNVLGLAVYLVVKDGLTILHLRLAKELENRRIKSKNFSGVDLGLTLSIGNEERWQAAQVER